MAQTLEKPSLVIFSSGKLVPEAEAVRDKLSRKFLVTAWTDGFFRSNELPLDTFLKNLLCFDAAVVILGADDLRESEKDGGARVRVPRDNVIFELGACMSRLGTQKTFIVCPEAPPVVLPSYFKGIYPLTYQDRPDQNRQAAIATACTAICDQFDQLNRNAYYSDLPAQGLAFGYFFNFVSPIYRRLRNCENALDVEGSWNPDCDFRIHIVIPPQFWGRDKVDQEFKTRKLVKFELKLLDGRNISIYRRRRQEPGGPLEIFDIPTTLITSLRVIDRVNAFWGGGEAKFAAQLEKREIVNFSRAISDIIHDDRELSGDCVKVINMEEFDDLMKAP